jgi:hypothetical protein
VTSINGRLAAAGQYARVVLATEMPVSRRCSSLFGCRPRRRSVVAFAVRLTTAFQQRSVMVVAADYDDWAGRVMYAMLAHRAEERFGESAMPAAPHHEQVGAG